MKEFGAIQLFQHRRPVLFELCHVVRNGGKGLRPIAQGKKVGHGQNSNPVWEGATRALSSHYFLKGGTGGPSTINFAVQQGHQQNSCGQGLHMGTKGIRCIRPGPGPNSVTGGVTDVRTNATALTGRRRTGLVVLQGKLHVGHHLGQAVWCQSLSTAGQLGQGQAYPVPYLVVGRAIALL